MQARGTIKSINRDYTTGRYSVTFELTEGDIAEIDALNGADLSLEMKRYRNPRSHSANALLWHCIGEIAAHQLGEHRMSPWEIYLSLLRKYGRFTMIAVRADAVDSFQRYYRECEEVGRRTDEDGNEWVHMLCYFGSSQYDSREFSVLLDGTIDDMRQAGLETPTSEEMRRTIEALERSEKGAKRGIHENVETGD